MRQFDTPTKSRKKAGFDGLAEAMDELRDELEEDSENGEGDRDEEREEREEEVDGREEMTQEEIQELDESVKPVRLVLTKVSQLLNYLMKEIINFL